MEYKKLQIDIHYLTGYQVSLNVMNLIWILYKSIDTCRMLFKMYEQRAC